MSYSFYNMRLGYGQGMNDICALLMDICEETNTPKDSFFFVSIKTLPNPRQNKSA